MDFTTDIGTEKVQRKALLILYDNLNDKITELSSDWSDQDDDFYTRLGRVNPGITIESIDDQNFVPGSIPSLINAPVDRYPNITCIAYRAAPQNSDDDEGEKYNITLLVVMMCKSDNFGEDQSHKGEEQVNSRTQKMAQAVHQVFVDNQTLENYVINIERPTLEIGEVFVRREEKARGSRWFWQSATLEYPVKKYVSL